MIRMHDARHTAALGDLESATLQSSLRIRSHSTGVILGILAQVDINDQPLDQLNFRIPLVV
jgi:hypothetical protein